MKIDCSHLEIQIASAQENNTQNDQSSEVDQTLQTIERWARKLNPDCISIIKTQTLNDPNLQDLIHACRHFWSKTELRIVIEADQLPDDTSLPEMLEETNCLLEIRADFDAPDIEIIKYHIERWQRTCYFNVVYSVPQSNSRKKNVLLANSHLFSLIENDSNSEISLDDHLMLIIRNGEIYYSTRTENIISANCPDSNSDTQLNNDLFNHNKIKLGFCIPSMSMGGVTRSLLTMMNAHCEHNLQWTGIAVRNAFAFDPETARLILEHCPIYSSMDHPDFQGLVTIVGNASQWIVDQSDIVNLWGYTTPVKELNLTDWKKRPMLVVAHGQNEWTRKNIQTSLDYAEESILVSVSKAGIQAFPKEVREQVEVIYNGVDSTHCQPLLGRDEIRRSWGINPETIAVGYIGRFAKEKNVFAAAYAVCESGNNHHAVYVGEGIHQAHVISRVKELCGVHCSILPRTEEIGSVLAGLDCLMSASPSEGGPLSVAEAWFAGCPVVSTPVGFIPELEEKYGPLVERLPHDPTPAQLAAGVKNAIQRSHIRQRAQEVAFNEFDAVLMVKKYESLLAKKLKESRTTTLIS